MAGYYEALPIYKAATDLVVLLDRTVRGFSRYHKYTLGSRLRDTAIEVTPMIARANWREDRAAVLPELCGRVEDLKRGLRVAVAVEDETAGARWNVEPRRLAYFFEPMAAPPPAEASALPEGRGRG